MKHIIICIALAATTLVTESCNDWLNVTPHGTVEADKLLTSEKGYNAALGGIYYNLASPTLYGRDLSYGMMDILAQYWDLSGKQDITEYDMYRFDYKNASVKSHFNSIWELLYQNVTQCNLILESLEKNRDQIKRADLIEGEAYGLRAFLHMDLLRLFGPVVQTQADMNQKSIAYRTKFDVVALPFETYNSVIAKIREDLQHALKLLVNDPIVTDGRKGDGNATLLSYNDVLNRRGSRMNYYAVLGLMMRCEQMAMNSEAVRTIGQRILDECKKTQVIALIDKTTIEQSQALFRDLTYSSEMLMGIYVNNLYDISQPFFGMGESKNTTFSITNELYTTLVNEVYGRTPDGAGTDNRLRYWFQSSSSSNDYYDFMKLKKAPESNTIPPRPYDPEVSVMRLSEVYYGLCEAYIGINNTKAMEYLNDVRETRNLPRMEETPNDDQLREYLMRERRKDFIGEGVMFSLYKRLFSDIYVKQGVTVTAQKSIFVFPIPDDEYEFSPNEKPENL